MLSRLIRSVGASSVNNKLFLPPPFVSYLIPSFSSSASKNIDPADGFVFHSSSSSSSSNSALTLIDMLLSTGICPVSYYNSVLSSHHETGNVTAILEIVQQWEQESQIHNNFFPTIHAWTILINCHCLLSPGNISAAFSLFHKIIASGHRPTTSILHDLFEGLCLRGQIYKAILFYNYTILKGFQLSYHTYDLLVNDLCGIGETKIAIHLSRQAPRGDIGTIDNSNVSLLYKRVISRLCKDRLVNQAYALFSEMFVNKIRRGREAYRHLIYGYCITGQFKEAIAMFKGYESPYNIAKGIYNPTLVTEQEAKAAKRAVAVLIKRGVKPHLASFQSVLGGMYRGGRVKVSPEAERLSLILSKPFLGTYY